MNNKKKGKISKELVSLCTRKRRRGKERKRRRGKEFGPTFGVKNKVNAQRRGTRPITSRLFTTKTVNPKVAILL